MKQSIKRASCHLDTNQSPQTMELTFLGTASNNPSPVRGVSCTCFRYEGEAWLFDAGEGTQIQLMKSTIKPGRITKVFITHLHGDHIFGLPGLMCTVGDNVIENKKLELYGPVGLRRYIRTCLELSRSFVTYSYVVHELVPLEEQIPTEVMNWKVVETDDSYLHPSETLGTQILADKNGHWHLFESDQIKVRASWIKHRVATFGFVVEQKPLPGRLDVEGLKKIGVMPGPVYKRIKNRETVVLENGQQLNIDEYLSPERPGKKFTYLGDCSAVSDSMVALAAGSEVLVHEATLENEFEEKAVGNGHSTPRLACGVAKRVGAACLILNHFSQRYKPIGYVSEGGEEPEASVQKLLDEAKTEFNGQVVTAYDLYTHKF